MSYCRFQNTLQDLLDCKDQLELLLCGDPEVTRIDCKDERRARIRLVETCFELVELFTSAGIDPDVADLQRPIERVVQENEDAVEAFAEEDQAYFDKEDNA
jgi:hypothetical protein